jgi:hypothetical protein
MSKPKKDTEKNIFTEKCKETGCEYHVTYDKNKPPIPGLRKAKPLKGKHTVYLKCNNPLTPHVNPYEITF